MSLYDEAAVALIAEGAAGKDEVLYNIKPEEKLKATELITDGSFSDESNWILEGGGGSGVAVTGGHAVFDGTSGNIDIYQDVSDLSGKTVKVSFRVSEYVAGDVHGIFYDSSGALTDAASGNGNFSFIKTIGSGHNDNVGLRGTNSFEGKVDNFSVKEVEQKPLDFTFTRGSNLTATRVAPSGYIEKGRENLFTYSNDFRRHQVSSAPWGHTGLHAYYGPENNPDQVPSGGADGYDRSGDASFLLTSTDDSRHEVTLSQTVDGVQTISIYAKAGGYNFLFIRTQSANNEAFFNLSTGSVGTTASSVVEAKMEDLGSGWYRCSMTIVGNFTFVAFGAASQDNVKSFAGDESSGIYIMNAQREMGTVVTDYIYSNETTGKAGILEDSPRFDYLGGGCPHWLVEPARRNLLEHSEYFEDSTTYSTTRSTLDFGHKSPEGKDNAYKLLADSSAGQSHFLSSKLYTVPANTYGFQIAASVFVKKGTLDHVRFGISDSDASDAATVYFDLTNGTVGTEDLDNTTGDDAPPLSASVTQKKIEEFEDDWYRITVTGKIGLTAEHTLKAILFLAEDDNDIVFDGNGTESVFIYGMQLEVVATSDSDSTIDPARFSSSYIPTHGSQVTREGEGMPSTNLGEYLNGDDFTFFLDIADNESIYRDGTGGGVRFSHANLTASSLRFYRVAYANRRLAVVFFDQELNSNPESEGIDTAGAVKVAIRRVKSTGEFTIFEDGTKEATKFGENHKNYETLRIWADGGSTLKINSVLIFDRALTDDECIALTT